MNKLFQLLELTVGINLAVFLVINNIESKIAGHFLLTNLLLETMKNTVQKSNEEGRIINVSSVGHFSAKKISFDKINKISR